MVSGAPVVIVARPRRGSLFDGQTIASVSATTNAKEHHGPCHDEMNKESMRCIFVPGLCLLPIVASLTTSQLLSVKGFTRRPLWSTALSALQDVDPTTDFWGRPRSRKEIVDFVSDAVFNKDEHDLVSIGFQDHGDALSSGNERNRWVEVISAEPPVRRSDFTFQFHSKRNAKTHVFRLWVPNKQSLFIAHPLRPGFRKSVVHCRFAHLPRVLQR
jgi:hypothetical protein